MDGWILTLLFAAATVGSLHALAPDHWVPFSVLGRARGWSAGRTIRLTLVCGLGHVTVSAAFGIAALLVGARIGQRMDEVLAAELDEEFLLHGRRTVC